MILLDTTVLLYATGQNSSWRTPCRSLVGSAARIGATATSGVFQEFLHVRARRDGRALAVAQARDLLLALPGLVEPPPNAVHAALAIFSERHSVGAFDAVLAAAAIALDAPLVSADQAFAEVSGLNHVIPDGAGVAALL